MKVAFLTELFPKLSETFILNQATGLIDRGHDVEIFADRSADEDKTHDEIEDYDLLSRTRYVRNPTTYTGTVGRIGRTVSKHPGAIPQVFSSVTRGKTGAARIANLEHFLNSDAGGDFDIFHAHLGTVGRAWDFLDDETLFPRAVTDTPFIVSFYGIDASYVLRHDPDAYDRLFSVADRVTVLSENMKSDLVEGGCPSEKIAIQPLGIDLQKFEFAERTLSPDESINLLTVARFDEQKGLPYAVDAVASLVEEYDLTYYIAGDGPRFDDIKERIERHGIDDSVELLGLVNHSELREYFEKAHAFLLPSVTAEDGRKEGAPTVLLEAQASGLPVVSTTHAGIPEIVDDGESGYLVPERDVSALTDALDDLLSDPAMWPEMGRHGRQKMEQTHSIPAVVGSLEDIYTAAAAESTGELT